MALSKTKTLENGAEVSYHRIFTILYNKDLSECLVTVMSYKNKAIRDASNKHIEVKTIKLSSVSDISFENLYSLLKATSEFLNAQDA